MDKKKVLVKVHPEGKFVVDIDKNIDIGEITPNCRVALRNDSYTLHKILPNKVDPLVPIDQSKFHVQFFIHFLILLGVPHDGGKGARQHLRNGGRPP